MWVDEFCHHGPKRIPLYIQLYRWGPLEHLQQRPLIWTGIITQPTTSPINMNFEQYFTQFKLSIVTWDNHCDPPIRGSCLILLFGPMALVKELNIQRKSSLQLNDTVHCYARDFLHRWLKFQTQLALEMQYFYTINMARHKNQDE
jgi:hypothetical protein